MSGKLQMALLVGSTGTSGISDVSNMPLVALGKFDLDFS